jgi:mono/diheme cytochrome c family protein
MYRFALCLGLSALMFIVAAGTRIVDASSQTPAASPTGTAIDPKPLYTKHCEMCHGRDGKAPTPEMGFIAREWKHGTNTADMIKTISAGIPGSAMLPFKGKLKEPEIAALASYVRSLDKRLKPEKGGGSD